MFAGSQAGADTDCGDQQTELGGADIEVLLGEHDEQTLQTWVAVRKRLSRLTDLVKADQRRATKMKMSHRERPRLRR